MSNDSSDDNDIKNSFKIDVEALESSMSKKIGNFNDLLESLSDAHAKKRALWKEIYENAVIDRRNAYIMYTDLYSRVHGNGSEHAIHGPTLSKYMERLTKSNDQLIKLAEIIEEAVEQDEDDALDPTTMFEQLENGDDNDD